MAEGVSSSALAEWDGRCQARNVSFPSGKSHGFAAENISRRKLGSAGYRRWFERIKPTVHSNRQSPSPDHKSFHICTASMDPGERLEVL